MPTSSRATSSWQAVETTDSETYDWPPTSTYIQNPPYFQGMSKTPGVISDISNARILALLGDMITTDHISPAGSFKPTTPAGKYLTERQVPVSEFNSYGARRGNHEVMMRGTFANIRIRNEMLDGVEGGYTKGPDGQQTSIFDASMAYQAEGTPLVIFGGVEYGAGSSRDWAAKGTALLGVKAVIAESFERIHRSNLVGMGVIPFEFTNGETRKTLGLKGDETVSISGLAGDLTPLSLVPCTILYADGRERTIQIKCRIDTEIEVDYVETRRRSALCAARPRQVGLTFDSFRGKVPPRGAFLIATTAIRSLDRHPCPHKSPHGNAEFLLQRLPGPAWLLIALSFWRKCDGVVLGEYREAFQFQYQ